MVAVCIDDSAESSILHKQRKTRLQSLPRGKEKFWREDVPYDDVQHIGRSFACRQRRVSHREAKVKVEGTPMTRSATRDLWYRMSIEWHELRDRSSSASVKFAPVISEQQMGLRSVDPRVKYI